LRRLIFTVIAAASKHPRQVELLLRGREDLERPGCQIRLAVAIRAQRGARRPGRGGLESEVEGSGPADYRALALIAAAEAEY
jgi:hypothetical protein